MMTIVLRRRAAVASLAMMVAACSGGGAAVPGEPSRAVTLEEWCSTIGEAMCTHMGDRCVGGSMGDAFTDGCVDGFLPGCLAGRDGATSSGRTAGELQTCVTTVDTSACEEILTVASGDACVAAAPTP